MLLTKIDMYGSKLNFTLNNQPSLKSIYGGMLTILKFFIYIVLFIFFAKDFYLKINPRVISEKNYLAESAINKFNLTNNTFLFAIKSPLTLHHPKLYKYSLNFIKEFDSENETIIKIDFITCDKSNHSNLFGTFGMNFLCFDYSKILDESLTSLYFANDIQSKYFQLLIEYDYNYFALLNETSKQTVLNTGELVTIFFPVLTFSSNNYSNPLEIKLDYNIFYLNYNTTFINRLRYAETKLKQDENFIFDSKKEIDSKVHIANQIQDYILRNNNSHKLAEFYFF